MDLDLISAPHVKDLASRGFVCGLTFYSREPLPSSSSSSSAKSQSQSEPIPLCHYYGNVRYAFPPEKRWRVARFITSDYVYGTKENPGDCTGKTGECPQPGRSQALKKKARKMNMEKTVDDAEEDCFQLNVWTPLDEEEPPDGGMSFRLLSLYLILYGLFAVRMVLLREVMLITLIGWPVFFFIRGCFIDSCYFVSTCQEAHD